MRRIGPIFAIVSVISSSCGVSTGSISSDSQSSSGAAIDTAGYNALNLAAGSMVLYELQVRSANACREDTGSSAQRQACAAKVSPAIHYHAAGESCSQAPDLEQIHLGTLDDLLEDTADFRSGITVRYVNEKVGANTLWIMPPFPNNDTWNLPDACDNLGSPYAVRDYFHAAGTLSRACIADDNRNELSSTPCWGNESLEAVIAQAHAKGMKVMLDVAFNHFGHNYLMYDYASFDPVRERVAANQDLNGLWNFAATDESDLLHPQILDTPSQLATLSSGQAASLKALQAKCPALSGDALVRGFNVWREAFDYERAQFNCDNTYLEIDAPGFYLGADHFDPSSHLGDNFTNNWTDVKFLFHHEENAAHQWEFARTREYLFRVLNYWTSRGVDGFRLDHTTDPDSGMGANEWKYITSKVDYYAWRRGQPNPVYMAEEFSEQMQMNKVVDAMTEGYVGDMCGRSGQTKDASRVESVLNNMGRFQGHAFTMTALETHDEDRLLSNTGFDVWTGAGFWGIGATTRSMPMMLMGQELGEPWGLGFRRSDFLRSRFAGSGNDNPESDALVGYYHALTTGRLAYENRALLASGAAFLRSKWTQAADPRIFAQVKWSTDGNVVFVFHNLWEQAVEQSYFIAPDLAAQLNISDGTSYRLVDIISGQQQGACKTGADLKWELFISMDAATRAQWLRLEECS